MQMTLTEMFVKLARLFGCGREKEKTVTSVDEMTLTLRGMHGGTVYKFENRTTGTELCRYFEKYSGTETFLELDKSAAFDHQQMISLINTCGIILWDGFHGKHPRNVHDGIMFCFKATVNDGQTIFADGSENFPNGYREFVRSLNEILAESEDE